MPSPGASEGFGQALNGASASSYACDTSAASSVATPRLCVWGPRLGSTASSPSVESVTLGLRLLPSPGASAVSKASCEARGATAARRQARGGAGLWRRAAAEKAFEADAACICVRERVRPTAPREAPGRRRREAPGLRRAVRHETRDAAREKSRAEVCGLGEDGRGDSRHFDVRALSSQHERQRITRCRRDRQILGSLERFSGDD